MPPNATSDSYVFYIGFDPQAVTPAESGAAEVDPRHFIARRRYRG